MFKNIKNNKGFTLIELLAVIVILGILMIIAIPQVTKYIEQSKKDTFADTAKAYINAARYAYLNDEISDCTMGTDCNIKLENIELEGGYSSSRKSSYGGILSGQVDISVTPGDEGKSTFVYKITIKDKTKKRCIINANEQDISRKAVQSGNPCTS